MVPNCSGGGKRKGEVCSTVAHLNFAMLFDEGQPTNRQTTASTVFDLRLNSTLAKTVNHSVYSVAAVMSRGVEGGNGAHVKRLIFIRCLFWFVVILLKE